MNLSDEDTDIIVTASHNLSNGPLSDGGVIHEEEEHSLRAFEGQGVSIIKEKELPPCREVDDQASHDILNKSGVEIVTCYLEDLE